MTRYVNPSLLQLAALGIEDDHYLPDGRHLRWTFSPDLGFPRSGFRLARRQSPLPWNSKRKDVFVRRAPLFASHIEEGEIRHREGLHVTADDGLDSGSDGRYVGVGNDTVRIRFTEDGSPSAASTPACWVVLRYRHRKAGSVAASAVFVDDDVRVQDRGASGRSLRETLGRLVDTPDLDTVRRIRDVDYLPTLTDASVTETQLERRLEATVVEPESDSDSDSDSDDEPNAPSKRITRLRSFDSKQPSRKSFVSVPRFNTVPRIDVGPILGGGRTVRNPRRDADEWIEGTFLLNGSVIDEVRVTGRLAEIESVEWITVDDYADADGWEHVDQFFLPIDGDDVTYPAQPTPGKQVARERLEHAPPKALGPWANDEWPPDSASKRELERERRARYLEGYDDLAEALETLVETEVREAKPQRSIRYGNDESMEAVDETNDDLSGSSMSVPLLEMLQVASLDPGIARMLGLATTDYEEYPEHVDYMVSADWWSLWLSGVLAPWGRDRILETFAERKPDEDGIRLPLPSGVDTRRSRVPSSQHATVVSVATDVAVAPREAIASPSGLDGDVKTRAGTSDVPAVVSLSWDSPDANLFTDDGHVAFAVRRRHDGSDESLVRTDPDSAVPLPHLPAAADGPNTFTDRAPSLGDSTYRVTGMDIWGRWSDFIETTETVTDTVAPPTPTGLRARLIGEDGPTWDLELSFDWTSGQRALAPDTVRFDVHCEQGVVDRSFTGWNGCETSANVYSPLEISWSDLTVSTPLSDVTATVDPAGAETDRSADARVTVTIPDVHAPFDSDHRARVSATVVAVDEYDNASDPARRTVAERVDPVEPTTESLSLEPLVATWPDADGYCYWTAEWSEQPEGSRTQVLRAPQARLLAAVDESLETFDERDTTGRVQRLREIATDTANQHAFSPDHEEPYDGETRHQVTLPAEDRGWTVVTVRHTGPTGTRGPWPSDDECFAVVRTPPTTRPPTPNLIATTDVDAAGEIQLTVAPDPSGATETVRLYRTPDRAAADDVRRMRPLAPRPASETDPIVVQDSVPADRWYAYRAVAVSASGLRSPPTHSVWVRADTNQPPTPPVVEDLQQPKAGRRERELEIRLTGYGLELGLRRRPLGTNRWTRLDAVPVADLDPTVVGTGVHTVTVTDRVPAGTADTRYEYRAVVTDRRGATAVSETYPSP